MEAIPQRNKRTHTKRRGRKQTDVTENSILGITEN